MVSTESGSSIAPADLIAGLGRGLSVIECFDDENPRMTATQVARRSGIPRTAARRHLLSLVHFGYADTDGKQFWLSPRVLRLGQSYLGSARLPRLVLPFAQRASQQCGETVNVSVLDGHEVVYIARSNPPRYMTLGYQVGARVPAHVVTPGPAILATWDPPALERWIAEHDFASFTALTVTDRRAFADEVRAAREQSYWATIGQLDAAFGGLSVPLIDRKGRCHGAIGTTVLSSQYDHALMQERLLPHLQEAAQALRFLL
jgi:IclR family transcriptional regulator, pca regulon regulatory protein